MPRHHGTYPCVKESYVKLSWNSLESHFPKLVTTVNKHMRVINSQFLCKTNFKDLLKQNLVLESLICIIMNCSDLCVYILVLKGRSPYADTCICTL